MSWEASVVFHKRSKVAASMVFVALVGAIAFADDRGFTDVGAFGGEIATPNIGATVNVTHEIAEPQRVQLREEIGLPHCDRIDDANIATNNEVALQCHEMRSYEIGIWRPERPIKIIG